MRDNNYKVIEQIIDYIRQNSNDNKSIDIDKIASQLNLSSIQLQQLFIEWSEGSAEQFLEYITTGYKNSLLNIGNTSFNLGVPDDKQISSINLFSSNIQVKPMDAEEYKNQGVNLVIYYSSYDTQFGISCVASTAEGICYISFGDINRAYQELFDMFPKATFVEQQQVMHQQAISFIENDKNISSPITLHIKGTPFQLAVWRALLEIPFGKLTTYGSLTKQGFKSKAYRAVGSAVGSNPISFIIPCHRVIRSNGDLGGYHWGLNLKLAMIGWESSQLNK